MKQRQAKLPGERVSGESKDESGAAQRPGALLAHDPADGVGNIGFSAAVRADDRCDIAPELQHRFIWKGLEALNFQ